MRALFVLVLIALLVACASNKPAPVIERSAAPPSASVSAAGTYMVKRGDTLYSIARELGVEAQQLMAWNQLGDARLSVGQVLRTQPPAGAQPNTDRPVISSSVIEARPLEPPPGVAQTAPAGSSPALAPAGTATLKTQPMGVKLPYSEQNLAQLQRTENAAPPAPPPAVVAPVAKSETPGTPTPTVTATASKDGVEWSWPASGAVIAAFGGQNNKGMEIGGKTGDPVYAAAAGKVMYSGTGVRGYGNLIIIKHNDHYLSAYAHNKSILVKQSQAVKRGQKIAEMGATGAESPKLHFEIRRMGQPVDPAEYLPPQSN